ncbi:MAG: hypothetical protein PHD21_04765 [Flavobacteriales bacterium]|nr:hypothetical protein [Flavobacteriales bacterium]
MENNLYDQILILAQKISNSSYTDASEILKMSREMYEKATIFSFLSENDIDNNAKTITQEDISMVENEWQILENEAVLDGKRDVENHQEVETKNVDLEPSAQLLSQSTPTENVIEEEPIDKVESPQETYSEVVSDNAINEDTVQDEESCDDKVAEKGKNKRQKHALKVDDTLQKSLFDQDLFSSEIIGFDPDEDIFVEATEVIKDVPEPVLEHSDEKPIEKDATEKIAPQTEPNTEDLQKETVTEEDTDKKKKSFFSITLIDSLDDESEKTDITEAKIEESTVVSSANGDNEPEIEPKLETQSLPSQNVPTVNDVIGKTDEKPHISLNEVLSSKNIVISLNDRLAFINNLFDGEVDDFENTVKYVFSQHNVDVVVEYISEIVKPYYNNWIEKEQYEKRFMDIVIKYFSENK